MDGGLVVTQPDCKWMRLTRQQNGTPGYCHKVLDVSGISLDPLRHANFTLCSEVVRDLPFPRASDHYPIDLSLTPRRNTPRKLEIGASPYPYLPEWLFEDPSFKDVLQTKARS